MTDRGVRIPFYPPEWRGTPVKLGVHWTLTKGKRKAVCVLWNHPVGAEMRLDVDEDLMQSKASRDYGELLDAARGLLVRLHSHKSGNVTCPVCKSMPGPFQTA